MSDAGYEVARLGSDSQSAAMPPTITAIRAASDDQWDACWQGCEYATFFQSREWVGIRCALTQAGLHPHPLAFTFSDGKTAIVPRVATTMHRGLVTTHCLSPGGGYGGWLSCDTLSSDHAVVLSHHLLELGNVEWLTNPFDPMVLTGGLLSGRSDETAAVRLGGGIEATVRLGSKGHRSAVKQAVRAGVAVRVGESLEDWRAYYAVYQSSIERWGGTATSDDPLVLFEQLGLSNSGQVVLWLATIDEEIVAGAVCLYARNHVSYWHGAAVASAFPSRPVNLLLHSAIVDACVRGKRWFDLGLSGGHEGVQAFKRGIGAEPMPCMYMNTTTRWRRWVGAMAGMKDQAVAWRFASK